MKNTLFLDDTFTPELLENEEALADETRNTIWLRFRTTSANNQTLQIYVKSVLYEIELTSSTDYNYQLPGLYWANDGVTAIRITNDDGATDYVYITFPSIIQTDAALQEVEDGNREYYLQGKEDAAQEIRSETISKTNGRDYYVDQLTKIIEFVFGSRAGGISGLLTFTVTLTVSGVTDEADAIFRIRVNRVFDEIFIPTQTVKNRKYIITICYPVNNIAATERNQVDIYMEMGEGTAEILQGNAIATITASSISTSGKFSGEIECMEIVEPLTIPDTIQIEAPAETLSIIDQQPTGATITETTPLLTLPEIQPVGTINDVARVVNYEMAAQRLLEDGETNRTTEDGDIRMTEEEHT